MGVRLVFFGPAARWVGRRELSVPWTSGRLGELLEREREALAPLQPHWESVRIAVDCEFAGPGTAVREGAEVAFLPPVSGG